MASKVTAMVSEEPGGMLPEVEVLNNQLSLKNRSSITKVVQVKETTTFFSPDRLADNGHEVLLPKIELVVKRLSSMPNVSIIISPALAWPAKNST